MPQSWRIVKQRLADAAFTGEGAKLYGGRWNSKGTPLVYTAGSQALAMLEMLVHLDSHEILGRFSLIEVTFDESLVHDLERTRIPSDWRVDPPPAAVRAVGDRWVRDRVSAMLRVPSAIVEGESNYLVNPAHPEFANLRIASPKPFSFDPRLLKTP